MMRPPSLAGDLSQLPDHGFGARSLTWWGVVAFFLIEGTAFALAIGAYFFLQGLENSWPPEPWKPADLLAGTLFTISRRAGEVSLCSEETTMAPPVNGSPGSPVVAVAGWSGMSMTITTARPCSQISWRSSLDSPERRPYNVITYNRIL